MDKNSIIKEIGKDFDFIEKMEWDGNTWYQAYMTEECFSRVDPYSECGERDCCGYEVGDTEIEALENLLKELSTK